MTIGHNVFIGANVKILQGMSIGDNSVNGTGAIITQDVPANEIIKVRQDLEFYELQLK